MSSARRRGLALCAALVLVVTSGAPAEAQEFAMHAGALAHALDRLGTTGRVLYIAAHPDDENTRLLAYLANARHLTVAYLSMTRGGGGQNLIGAEQGDLLDLVRTHELLAARRLDGARQRFTRMRDFGYSKTADETLANWGHQEALSDVVWVMRTFRPDVVIARFDERPPNHGHHTASAVLAREAFAAAAAADRFPEQLTRGVDPWQASRLLLNLSPWREEPPPPDAIALDVGVYDARLGIGYAELAARSRSQHKSQGFGVAGERGPVIERFVPVAGTVPSKDILADIDVGWGRFGSRAAPFAAAVELARAALERDRPERAVPALLQADGALDALPDGPHARDARAALREILTATTGLFVRAIAARPGAVPGGRVEVRVEIALGRPAAVRLLRVRFPGAETVEVNADLGVGEKREVAREVRLPADAPVSAPYWLADAGLPGRHTVADPALVGDAEGPPPLAVGVEIGFEDRVVRLETPVVHVWTDPVHGERIRSFLVVPPATVTPVREAVLFANGAPASVALRVRAGADDCRGEVTLPLPAGWRAEPTRIPVTLARAGDETTVRFEVTPAAGARAETVGPAIEIGRTVWASREDVIDYPHIPTQLVLRPATVRLVPLELALPPGPVGYMQGPGDTVADDLAHAGLDVELLDDETIRGGDLSRYTAIITGIRAYNTRDALRAAHERLVRYVENGGTLVVQYNTNSRLAPLEIPVGPFPLVIGRDRVTDETAAMVPVNPEHPVLHRPNRLGAADFAGWVQERGLYYAATWDERYEPIFRTADPGEEPLLGGLLVARHGRGRYVYTGLAFFRQLPAGVPGGYRLLANLLAGG